MFFILGIVGTFHKSDRKSMAYFFLSKLFLFLGDYTSFYHVLDSWGRCEHDRNCGLQI